MLPFILEILEASNSALTITPKLPDSTCVAVVRESRSMGLEFHVRCGPAPAAADGLFGGSRMNMPLLEGRVVYGHGMLDHNNLLAEPRASVRVAAVEPGRNGTRLGTHGDVTRASHGLEPREPDVVAGGTHAAGDLLRPEPGLLGVSSIAVVPDERLSV